MDDAIKVSMYMSLYLWGKNATSNTPLEIKESYGNYSAGLTTMSFFGNILKWHVNKWFLFTYTNVIKSSLWGFYN